MDFLCTRLSDTLTLIALCVRDLCVDPANEPLSQPYKMVKAESVTKK